MHCRREEETLVRIEIKDTGVGIAPEQIPLIYDEFYQIGIPTNTSRDGYGLGLSIVQRLVRLLTLKLDVRSELSRGSTCRVDTTRETLGAAGPGSPGLRASSEL